MTETELKNLLKTVAPPDEAARAAAHAHWAALAKPLGGLGQLETMVEAAAANGWIDRTRVIDESLTGIFRAGADSVLTYWALEVARRVR